MDALCRLILELYRAAKETPVDEFQELALALVKAQTSFHTAFWGAGEMTETGLVAYSVHLHNEPQDMLSDWALINQNDTVVDEVINNSGRTLISHAPSRYSAHGQNVMLDHAHRFGHLNYMTITSMSRKHPTGQWLSLYRPDKHDHFGQTDSRILEQVMPHLIEALEINRMLGQVNASIIHDPRMVGARALARTDGTLYHCGKIFSELLLEVWPKWKNAQLPAELMTVLRPGRESILADHAIAVSASTLGNLLLLNIRRVSPIYRLSRREHEVAKLYGQGQSHKEIGLLLDISPSTVRNFVGRIYTKLDINNKVDLISLLSNK